MRAGPPPLLTTLCVSTRPSTISLSSIVPPTFFTMRMFLKSTLSAVFMSMVLSTESTAIGPSRLECWDTILDDNDVDAAWRSVARSVSEIGCDMSCRVWTAAAAARWKDSEMMVGWMPGALVSGRVLCRLPRARPTLGQESVCGAEKASSDHHHRRRSIACLDVLRR